MAQSEIDVSPALPETARNQTEVYAVHGADPEVLAYAMAKYSRSSLSMKESLREISSQRAEHFLNTFYFQYGHRSIADLAHVAFAVERLSLLAAIILPGAGFVFVAFLKVILLIWLVTMVLGLFAAARFRRHIRRYKQSFSDQWHSWEWPK